MTTKVTRYRWVILILAIIVLGYACLRLFDMNQRMSVLEVQRLSRGPVWFVTSVEFDTLRLNNTLLKYADDQADSSDVQTAFDILWSRLDQMRRGVTLETLNEYGVDLTVYNRLASLLETTEDRVAALGPNDAEQARALVGAFEQELGDLRAAGLDVLQASLTESNDIRVDLVAIARTILVMGLILSGATFLLFVVFALDSVQSRRSLREQKALLQEAHAADIAKSQFIAVISHELRTPLTSITASLELLKRGIRTQSPATAGRLVEIAEHNCTALRRLVNDLLDAEKFESGKMEFDFQVVDLSRMLERTIESNKAYAASYGVEIVSDGIEPDVRIKADAPRIDQLMSNLLSNAVKFSERDGKVEVNLRTDTGRAIVSVRDHGRGIPQKDRSRIFERFQQVDSSNERERGGTGLGLAIVKAIAKAHDAGLTVESELGKGSTFIVSFPLAE
ncbi:hypothetical protein GQE99_00530 [Maritimibacter sp. DP07]|jgi:signal transduction histidine kinase|uniref:histidine kinase n=1 Tax=Maritimibacter harenae TaxID=2606218 RepID=A0A845M1B3_9RHOB|nr:ATP-binding protein [Maritimibacter harenae]MZR11517.1 hypothetical protein [Maritimibacter harenae]